MCYTKRHTFHLSAQNMNLNYPIWIIVLLKSFQEVFANDFPSLLVANASVGL